jgi:NADPH:quinone reductase-like Zn-dependent oxidoreductase
MNAVVLNEYGDAAKLLYREFPEPKPGVGEVLIRVLATSVNPIDYKLRSGAMKERMPLQFPVILGRDVAGEVTALGAGVTTLKEGDLVMGLVNHSYAEYLTAKVEGLSQIPEGLDHIQAGVLPLILQTGSQLIESGVKPHEGETILVTGALGSVGRTAIFVAKAHGAKVFAGVRQKELAEAGSLGADGVFALDGDLAALPQLDAIADTVGGDTVGKLLGHLKKSGRLATVVGKPKGADGIDVREVWAQPEAGRLHQLAVSVRDGELKIPIAMRLPLSKAGEAQLIAEKGAGGKVALIP